MCKCSDAANNLAGTKAACANIHNLSLAVNDNMNTLYVGSPAALCPALGMADQITGHYAARTDFTKLTH